MRPRRRRILAGIATAMVLVVVSGVAFVLTYRPDRARFPVRGIDVSHHQGDIDWSRVAGDDVQFAYIKASEGGDYRDTKFATNRMGAVQAGIRAGAYHFFTLCRPGLDQAENFLTAVGKPEAMLPPAIDLEFGGNCDRRPSPQELTGELSAFLAPVEARFARPAVLYATDEFLEAYRGALPERRLWRRSLFTRPNDDHWSLWQYHNAAWVAGVAVAVDLDVFHGNSAEFESFANAAIAGR